MDELLDKYQARFGDQFPLMLCRTKSDDEICEILKRCLDDNKPFTPELKPDANY